MIDVGQYHLLVTRLSRRIRKWSGALALVAYQVVPLPTATQTAEGRLDVAFGAGADAFSQQRFSCDNALLAQRPAETLVISAVLDYMATEDFRLSAFFGNANSSTGTCQDHSSNASGCPFPPPASGAFGGASVGYEGPRLGLGLGIVAVPTFQSAITYGTEGADYSYRRQTDVSPTGHVRIGNREKGFLRLDVGSSRIPGTMPMTTVGFGAGQPGRHNERLFLGVGLTSHLTDDDNHPAIFIGNIAIPVSTRGDILLGAFAGSSQMRGVNAGARFSFSAQK